MRFNSLLSTLLLTSLLLGGCAPASRVAKPVEVNLPDAPRQLEKVTPAEQQRYDTALAAMRGGDLENAEKLFLLLTQEHVELTGPHLNLAIIAYKRGDRAKAVGYLDTVIRYDPRNATAYTLQGVILREQNRFRDAEVAYTKALKADPNHALAHLNLAILYDLYFQYYSDALQHYQRYQDLAGEDEKVQLWINLMKRRM